MSIYAVINESEPAFFSSTQGWRDVAEFIESLEEDDFEELLHLTEHGYTEDIPAVAVQIVQAIANDPSEDIKKTLIELAGLLEGEEDEDGVLLITNGMVPDSEAAQ